MKDPGGAIAEHHTLKAVSKCQPLKHNGERALTPAVHCQIRHAVTVVDLLIYSIKMSCTEVCLTTSNNAITYNV